MQVVVNKVTTVVRQASDEVQILQVGSEEVQVLSASLQGPPGPSGAPGPTGPTGPTGPGGTGTTYIHVQSSAAATWTITHNLGQFPSVTVVDSSGREVEGDVSYTNSNSLTVSFSGGFSGKAYLN